MPSPLPRGGKVGDFFGLRVQELAERAAFLVRNEPLRVFGCKAADTLVHEGGSDAVMAYLESSRPATSCAAEPPSHQCL